MSDTAILASFSERMSRRAYAFQAEIEVATDHGFVPRPDLRGARAPDWDVDALLTLPSHLRKRLESALLSGSLAPPYQAAAVLAEVGHVAEVEEVVKALRELAANGVSGAGCAALLRGLDRAASRRPTPDFVWSGPEVPGLHARDTRRVYEELLGSASRSAWVATYAFFDGPRAFEVLARRMDETPALKVTLLLNVQRKPADTTSAEHLVRRFADRFWKDEWPGGARPRVFYEPRSVHPHDAGVLHAKAVVADDEAVFVTSANLTEAALDHNIEVGLLVRDRTLVAGVTTHFTRLIDRSLLRRSRPECTWPYRPGPARVAGPRPEAVRSIAMDRRLLTRVVLRNYKSIAACDVEPAQLSFLVGPNGSGKSNFLDALRFIADSLRFSIDHALRDRGGISEVRRRSGGHPTHFGIRVEFSLEAARGHYTFRVGARAGGGYEVQREECRVFRPGEAREDYYDVESGRVTRSTLTPPPAAAADRLYLVNVSGVDAFRPVYDALSGTGFYNLNPEAIRDLQQTDPGELLKRDGSNAASVLSNLGARSAAFKRRIEAYLGKVVPGVVGVDRRSVGPRETLEFRQEVRGAQHPWRFFASNMSDGTLRAFGVLLALFQVAGNSGSGRRLVGIEEPEVALHPAAAGILIDGLRDAAEHAQILVTSHSPDLLDNEEIPTDSIFAVVAQHGESRIGPLDETSRGVLRDHLYTAGELLRMGQLAPDAKLANVTPKQIELFGPSS